MCACVIHPIYSWSVSACVIYPIYTRSGRTIQTAHTSVSRMNMYVTNKCCMCLRVSLWGGYDEWPLEIIELFCRIQSLLQGSFAKEIYTFKEPTHRSQPILEYSRRDIVHSILSMCTHPQTYLRTLFYEIERTTEILFIQYTLYVHTHRHIYALHSTRLREQQRTDTVHSLCTHPQSDLRTLYL